MTFYDMRKITFSYSVDEYLRLMILKQPLPGGSVLLCHNVNIHSIWSGRSRLRNSRKTAENCRYKIVRESGNVPKYYSYITCLCT